MDFAFSEEQQMLRTAAREFLTDRFPIERVVTLIDAEPGWDPSSWKDLADLGWLDPELGVLEHAVIAEEAGYALLPGPWWATVALCGGWRTGDRPATLAWAERGNSRLHGEFSATLDGGRVSGEKRLVPDATLAEEFFVTTNAGVCRVAAGADGVRVVPRSTTDRSRRLADVVFERAPAEPVADRGALTAVRLRALALLACEAVGVGQRCLDVAAEYAKAREQFGRPIGSYQGVSHRIANVYVAVQLARSLAYWAAWCVAEADTQAPAAVAGAKAGAAEAAVFAAENAIQAMGGIGFTWDHPLHRFYKRAQWIDAFEGSAAAHRAEVAARLLDQRVSEPSTGAHPRPAPPLS